MANPPQMIDPVSTTSEQEAPQNPNQAQSSPTLPDPDTIFRRLQSYPFEQDPEFQAGITAIHKRTAPPTFNGEADHDAELLLELQCFYFGR